MNDETDQPVPAVPAEHPLASAARVRSFVRRGRFSDQVRERIALLGPGRALPPGRFDARATFGREAPVVLEIGSGHGAAGAAGAGERRCCYRRACCCAGRTR